MKKFLLVLATLLLIVGCDIVMSSPTKRVERFLSKYQTIDEEVLVQLDEMVNKEETLNEELKKAYKEVMKNQYQNLYYIIKDEKVDGNHAVVTVEIEVFDYSKSMRKADDYLIKNEKDFSNEKGEIDSYKFMTYKIDKMKNTKDKIKYTIEFKLTKNNNKWNLDEIDEVTRQKIHGTYIE